MIVCPTLSGILRIKVHRAAYTAHRGGFNKLPKQFANKMLSALKRNLSMCCEVTLVKL